MKYADLQKKTEEDMMKMLAEYRTRLQELGFKIAANQVKNVREVRQIKKDIARILTHLKATNKKTEPTT